MIFFFAVKKQRPRAGPTPPKPRLDPLTHLRFFLTWCQKRNQCSLLIYSLAYELTTFLATERPAIGSGPKGKQTYSVMQRLQRQQRDATK